MTDDGHPNRDIATVTRLPVGDGGDVVEGEIVSEAEYARVRRQAYRRDVVAVARVTRTVVTHPRTVTTAQTVGRHAVFTVAGAVILARRAWESRSNTAINEQLRAATLRGDVETWERLCTQAERSKHMRHRRMIELIKLPFELAKAAGIMFLLFLGFLLFAGVVWAAGTHDVTRVIAPVEGVVTAITWVCVAVAVGWVPFVAALPAFVTLACWWTGRKADVTPTWLSSPSHAVRDTVITPARVVLAFRDLGIAHLAKSIRAMGDAGAGMLSSIRIAGCGIEVDVTLPQGVSTDDVIRRRRKLAENLDRHEHEVFPAVAPVPRTVRVWAADPGALDEPIGPSPLVFDDSVKADYKRGKAPWGQNLRGDAVTISLYQRHLLVVGLSNQGKTAGTRSLALWLALDKTVELRIADLKGIGDWAMFNGIATVLIEGPSDEHVIEATEMLEAGVREMERRLRDGGSWNPLILIVDESQQAYMCPAKDEAGRPYGGAKSNSRYLTAVRKTQNQGRAVDVLLWQGTQNPTNQNLPVLAREGAHLRICTAVGTEEQAKMALGDKAVNAGAAPHLLRAGLDKGTVVVAGDGAPLSSGQASVTVRTYFVDDEGAEEIAARAAVLRGPIQDVGEERDLLQDVHEALGSDDLVRAADMVARLRELAPGFRRYSHLDGKQLAVLLASEGVEVRRKDGYPVVRADRVLRALDDRQGPPWE